MMQYSKIIVSLSKYSKLDRVNEHLYFIGKKKLNEFHYLHLSYFFDVVVVDIMHSEHQNVFAFNLVTR